MLTPLEYLIIIWYNIIEDVYRFADVVETLHTV
nr:MAG TPA: hypothetical protein [Caudoviricetes sp.]